MLPAGIGRHSPAKQNQSSPALVNFHFVFGDLVPVNSKKCDAGTRHRPTEKVTARPGFDLTPAVRNSAIHEIKSPLILQPGPAALTVSLAELQRIIEMADSE